MNFDRVIAVRNDKTIYRDYNTVIKVFENNYRQSEVLSEALTQTMIREISLPVPKVQSVGALGDKWYIETEYIPGKTLAQLMTDNPTDKEYYLNLFVDLQMAVHSKYCPDLKKLKDKMTQKIGQTALDAPIKEELQTRLASMPDHNKICHGDFNPTNIIIRDDGAPYVLDWSHVTCGNASADAVRSYFLFRLNGDTDTAEDYLRLFCRKSGTDLSYVQNWMPIVAAAQLVRSNERERRFLYPFVKAWKND